MTSRRLLCFALLALLLGMRQAHAQLLAHTELNQTGSVFSYTLFNDEPVNSPNFLTTFHLTVDAPITVTGIPTGWDFVTDNRTYVDWFNTDTTLPYPNDVAPSSSLSGFIVESAVTTTVLLDYTVTSWDHTADAPGSAIQDDFVLAPSGVAAAAPEPSSLTIMLTGSVVLLLLSTLRMILARRKVGRKA